MTTGRPISDYFESDEYRAAVRAAVTGAPTPDPAQKAALRRIFSEVPAPTLAEAAVSA